MGLAMYYWDLLAQAKDTEGAIGTDIPTQVIILAYPLWALYLLIRNVSGLLSIFRQLNWAEDYA